MGNYLRLHVHLVWSTKHRRPVLTPPVRRRLYPYLAATIQGQRVPVKAIGGWIDHIHIYTEIPSWMSVGQLVSVIKSRSSRWIRAAMPELANFAWQRGYGASSVDPRHPRALVEYIRRQEAHHSRTLYVDEITAIAASYGLDASNDPGD